MIKWVGFSYRLLVTLPTILSFPFSSSSSSSGSGGGNGSGSASASASDSGIGSGSGSSGGSGSGSPVVVVVVVFIGSGSGSGRGSGSGSGSGNSSSSSINGASWVRKNVGSDKFLVIKWPSVVREVPLTVLRIFYERDILNFFFNSWHWPLSGPKGLK